MLKVLNVIKKDYEKGAPEVVQPRGFTKSPTNPEKTFISGTKNSNDQKENYSTNYMLTKTIGDKELEYTKPMEFKPAKRPEEAIQGNVICFMYSPSSDPSA